MNKSTFYHAGCPVCVSAETSLLELLDPTNVEVINLNTSKDKLTEAEKYGVQSVPALVTPNGQVLHINFGASIDDLK